MDMRKLYIVGFLILLILGAFFRFSFLDWGKPFFFHPDENNITSAILQLSLSSWNPHFFAYGGLPIYFTFLLSLLVNLGKNSFSDIAYLLRFISASLSFLLIPSLFYIGEKMYNKKVGLIAALLASGSIGLIQFAHFGTFEMWLTFFGVWFSYFCFALWKKFSWKHFLAVCIFAGVLMSIKVSSIVFLPIPFIIFLFNNKTVKIKLLLFLCYCTSIFLIYSITNPFLFLDTNNFVSSLRYESLVALGGLQVFYTQSFLHSPSVIFQLLHVLPFLLNPIVFLFSLISFLFFVINLVKKRHTADFFVFLFFCLTFFSQAFLFVKWTRYMVPVLPFIYIITAVEITKLKRILSISLITLLVTTSYILSFAFLYIVYSTDSRITASNFIKSKTANKVVIMEPYDLGAIVFNPYIPQVQIVNLYNLDQDTSIQTQLLSLLPVAHFFISPSQRLIHTRLTDQTDYPKGNMLYKKLFNGSIGYNLIYQTPCDFWCHIIYLGDPIHGSVEETASVFDHPFVSIFEKTHE